MTDINTLAELLDDVDPEPTKVGGDVYVPILASNPEPMFTYIKYEDIRQNMDLDDDDGTSDFRIN